MCIIKIQIERVSINLHKYHAYIIIKSCISFLYNRFIHSHHKISYQQFYHLLCQYANTTQRLGK